MVLHESNGWIERLLSIKHDTPDVFKKQWLSYVCISLKWKQSEKMSDFHSLALFLMPLSMLTGSCKIATTNCSLKNSGPME